MRPIARKSGAIRSLAAVAAAVAIGWVLLAGTGLLSQSESFWESPDLHPYPAFLRRAFSELRARRMLALMGDDEILAQVLMVGYRGAEPPSGLLSWIDERGIGGVKVFGWNAEDTTVLARTLEAIQKRSLAAAGGIPTLVATDQEGGWIRHVKGRTSESPGNMAIGATSSQRDAYLAGYHIAVELRTLGIFMNFAPVVDIATDLSSGIIGPRAFSSDPEAVARLGQAFARGTLAAGVVPTAKHYPGHGATRRDSHGILPLIDVGEEVFRTRELLPFAWLSRDHIPAIMSGHLAFPAVGPDETPASLSRYFIDRRLKHELGFRGLVITDDLYMVGAIGEGTILEASVRAINAGNDMILPSTAPQESGSLWTGLQDTYARDAAFRMRVREAAARVLATKLEFLRPVGRGGLVPRPDDVSSRLPDPKAAEFFRGLARRSVTSLTSRAGLPFLPEGKVLVAAPFDTFLALAKDRYPHSDVFRFSYRPETRPLPAELAAFRARLSGCSAAIVAVANASGLEFARTASDAGLDVAIVSVLSPATVLGIEWPKASVAVYHYAPDCLEAGLDALSGRLVPRGRLPIARLRTR